MFQRLFVAVLIMSGALLAAHLIKTIMSQPEEVDRVGEVLPAAVSSDSAGVDYQRLAEEIMASGIFDSRQALSQGAAGGVPETLSTAEPANVQSAEPPIEAAAKVRLIGTASGPQPLRRAVIEDVGTKKQTLYRLHDSIPNVGEIDEIREEGILIRRGHQQEFLELQNVKRAYSFGVQRDAASYEAPGSVIN
ncbi:MAG: hypothetical protein OJF52_001949 [Nitrospira sp.]|jgi:general secretion pathway protein C|nr:MAG: hypothetical protein OJF52_001949 [Nitrospira sp.]